MYILHNDFLDFSSRNARSGHKNALSGIAARTGLYGSSSLDWFILGADRIHSDS